MLYILIVCILALGLGVELIGQSEILLGKGFVAHIAVGDAEVVGGGEVLVIVAQGLEIALLGKGVVVHVAVNHTFLALETIVVGGESLYVVEGIEGLAEEVHSGGIVDLKSVRLVGGLVVDFGMFLTIVEVGQLESEVAILQSCLVEGNAQLEPLFGVFGGTLNLLAETNHIAGAGIGDMSQLSLDGGDKFLGGWGVEYIHQYKLLCSNTNPCRELPPEGRNGNLTLSGRNNSTDWNCKYTKNLRYTYILE